MCLCIFYIYTNCKVICPDCGRTSITFDPLVYLSLPIPVSDERVVPVTMVFADPLRKPIKYGVKVMCIECSYVLT